LSAEPQEFIYYAVRDPAAFLEDHFSSVWVDRFNGVQGIYGRLRDAPENPQPMALLFMKSHNWDMDRVKAWIQEHPQYVKPPETPGIQTPPPPPLPQSLIGEYVRKDEIRALLPRSFQLVHWGYGPQELIRKIKQKVAE